jgi:hypothetical protein
MKDGHGEVKSMGPEVGDAAVKAGKAGPQAKARSSGDNLNIGDKKIINKIAAAYKGMTK